MKGRMTAVFTLRAAIKWQIGIGRTGVDYAQCSWSSLKSSVFGRFLILCGSSDASYRAPPRSGGLVLPQEC